MSDTASGPETAPDPARWRVLWVLLAAIFMSLVGVSIVNVALPTIESGLGADESDVQWVLSGYALTFGVFLVAAGRAGDIMGRGGFFILGVVIFTASSVAAGFAPDAASLNGSRFIQGVGSGLISPQGVGMIQQYFRGRERGRAFGYFGSAVGVAVGIGPVLGGFLIRIGGTDWGWRLTFLVNLPIGVICVVLALLWFPRPLFSRIRDPRTGTPVGLRETLRRLDPVGAVLLGVAVLAILLPFVESGAHPVIWASLPLGAGLVYLWVLWERRYRRTGGSPMVDLGIFRTRSFTNGTIIVGLYFLGMTSVWVLVALYLQDGAGHSALAAGSVGIPSAVMASLASTWAGRRVSDYGRKVVIGGLVCGLFGLLTSIGVVVLHESGHASEWWLVLTLAFVGTAQGSVISPNQTLTLAEVPLEYAGSSGAVMQTGQRIGTSVGIAVITAIVFGLLGVTSWGVAIPIGFAAIAAVLALALLVAVKDQRDRTRSGPEIMVA
ncbi:MFS transporter [Gordonia shandongensis]|uniref:MFS transporter n=1 Tax=Gordonia shandongensis TaxID=376351 RepID=UPI0005580E6C|nr:MFS transporter [Gordonia shandongensis]